MKISLPTFTASMLALAIVASPVSKVTAAELQILAGSAMADSLKQLGGEFEIVSGHDLIFHFGTTPELIKFAATDGAFDVAVVPREMFNDAAARTRFVAAPPSDIARVGEVVFVASVAANTKEAKAARAFIAWLRSPMAAAAIKAKGMEPASVVQVTCQVPPSERPAMSLEAILILGCLPDAANAKSGLRSRYADKASFLSEVQSMHPAFAIYLDKEQVWTGFAPAMQYHTNRDGSVSQ